ncbi:protein tsct-1-like isoform X1 [Euwallacea similis]|uniref:protein tsct-1-like isoform X1 n=1 Tax=Euwallacea similis TaxID=1736056 RepID=UPI0034505EC2
MARRDVNGYAIQKTEMTSIAAKNKKGTVIHRTTSETLRLGDEAFNTQGRATTRKKSQATSPSCSFQITGVLTRYDQEDESADDLDESHTDEISRVTDNETPSFSEDSRDEQQPQQVQTLFGQNPVAKNSPAAEELPPRTPPSPPVVKEEPKQSKENINNCEMGRFRVVKLAGMGPFSRGRWTCYDYVDESSDVKEERNPAITKPYWESSCQPSYVYTGSILLPEPIPIYVPLSNERPVPISSQCPLPMSRVSFPSCQTVDTVVNNFSLDTNQNKQSLAISFNQTKVVPLQPDSAMDGTIKQETGLNSNDNTGASVSCTATIDTKIEHALDVVKNHLTHAVRLEVEELKVKINELVERISFLEYENDMLRSNVTPEVLANLGNRRN